MVEEIVGMAAKIERFDWAATALGPRSGWPATLRLMVGVALKTRFPMLVLWGPDLIQVYNDAFAPILGARQKTALGQFARDCWPEIWDVVGPMLTGAFETGTPVWAEDLPLVLERNGYPEQTSFTFSYSRLGDEGEIGGVLCTCVETTKSVARERQYLAALDREHRASLAFQNAALPKRLPSIPGLRFDAIYEAASKDALVGGDWYDAFRLPDGRVVVSVGDVIGNGLDAAVTMASARQAIRGAAQVLPEPVAVLDAADRALRSEQPDRIVTAFLGVLDPLTFAFTYASAGHPPAMLRYPDGTVCELRTTDLPLGLRNENASGESVTVMLPENALLVLYTDGLTESTRNVVAGEQRLRDVLASDEIYDAVSPAAAIRRAFIDAATDDIAILTIGVGSNAERITRWVFRGDDAAAAMDVRRKLVQELRSANASEVEVADAELVFGELLGNAVRHTDGQVEAALDFTGDEPILHVLDQGPGFRFHARLPNDDLSESGRGLFITKKLAQDVSVAHRPGGGSHARVVLAARQRRFPLSGL